MNADMIPDFEWDERKARINLREHGVSFEEALTVFSDPLSLTLFDDTHSDEEDRFKTIGLSYRQRVLIVVHCERGETGETIRLISARRATAAERREYEEDE